MKHHLPQLWVALVLGSGLAQSAPIPAKAKKPTTTSKSEQKSTPPSYAVRLKILQESADWVGVRQLTQQWEKVSASTTDTAPYLAEADAAYKLGDIDEGLKLWRALYDRDPSLRPLAYQKLLVLNKIRRNYPDLKLQPLIFLPGDASVEAGQWKQKGAGLLAAKKYEEIEKTAATLQESNAARVTGSPNLNSFFYGLIAAPRGDFTALQSRISTWRTARPKSDLARLAEVAMWNAIASEAQGDDMAATIPASKKVKVDAALKKSSQLLASLPKSASQSPLSLDVALTWVLLAGQSRQIEDALFTSGIAKFPNYLPLYETRAFHLLPRWLGEPGEAEALLKHRADEIGGDDGDIFYGRIVWNLSSFVGELSADTNFDYDRAQRGLKVLGERFPDSISVSTARFALAFLGRDRGIMQQILSSPQGNQFDTSWMMWRSHHNQSVIADYRMTILAEPFPSLTP